MRALPSAQLNDGARVLLCGIRDWRAVQSRGRLASNTQRTFAALGEPSIYRWITALVLLAARDADRLLTICVPSSHELSADELALVRAVGAAGTSLADARLALRPLTGESATCALLRCVEAVATRFRLLGLSVEIAESEKRPERRPAGRA